MAYIRALPSHRDLSKKRSLQDEMLVEMKYFL